MIADVLPEIAGVVLAGGASRRMGGIDKTGLDLAGRPMMARVVDRLAEQVGTIIINARGPDGAALVHGLPVVPDSYPDRRGPLAGVLAGMDWASDNGYRYVLTVAGDTPFFPADLAARLHAAMEGGSTIALAASRTSSGVRRHPTFGLWLTDLKVDLRRAIDDGIRKVVAWTDSHEPVTVVFDADGLDPFFNVNTPHDLELASRLCKDMCR